VCPLRYGTGVKNKLLATLAMKVPAVATPHSLLGLEAVNEEHLLVAQGPEAFAEQVGKLLADPQRADRMAASGRKLIEDRYAWSTYATVLEDALASLERPNAQ
jgi:glycosyltransferase involved in cell wall biosynthesis